MNILTKYFWNLSVFNVCNNLEITSVCSTLCIYVIKFGLENQLSTYPIFNYFALHAMFSYNTEAAVQRQRDCFSTCGCE